MSKDTLLRRALTVDAVISGGTGLLMTFAAAPLGAMLAISPRLLLSAGVICIGFASFLVYLLTRDELPRVSVWTVIVLNAIWVLGSIAVLFDADPNRLGVAFIVVQAIAVAGFAEAQYVGLRKTAAG